NDIFISSTFRKFLLPTILSLLGGTICNFTDSIIVGNLMGAKGLAAMGVCTPVFFIYTTLGSLLGVGGATLASVRVGKDDIAGVNRLFTLSLSLILFVGLAFSALCFFGLEPLLTLLGAKGEIRDLARQYCLYYLPGAWTTMLLYIPLNFFRITGKPNMGAWMFGIMAVSNIALSLFFMLTLKMGIAGVALGTVLGTSLALLFSLKGFFSKTSPLRLRPFGSELRNLPALLVTGSPMALSNLLNVLRTLFFNRLLLLLLGSGGITIFAVLTNVNTFSLAILSGVSQTLVPLTGVFFGERDTQSIRRVMETAIRWGMLLAGVFALALSLCWKPVCLIFGLNTPELFPEARFALIMFAVSLLPAMLSNLYQFHFMTIRRVWLANLISISRSFALPALLSLMVSAFNIHGVWLGFPLGEALTLPLIFLCTGIYSRKKALSSPLLLDESARKSGKSIAFSVATNVDAIMDASQKISDFCSQNQLDPKRSMLISLSIEELLISIIDHVFPDKPDGSMDVRIFVTGEEAILRIRNGGTEFDPIRFFETHPDDIEMSLGIQMITSSAKDVRYTRTLGVNNLSVLV
ncbi:MAG: MATE family efflux transporter, partial [Oscillospiraceae bacterium]